jgi:glycerophosphoryl diester phosphodiesterase
MTDLLAHRGASAELPENTLPAFARALELGATCLETDAHLTADGAVVLSHDPNGARVAGDFRPIARLPLTQVRAWGVPTLGEALEAFPDARFNVDCKDPRGAEALVRAAKRAEARVLLTSFETRTLRAMRALGWRGRTGLSRAEVARLVFAPLVLLRAVPLKGNAAQIPLRALNVRLDTRALVAKAHALGLVVHYWVVNDPREAERLLDLGADGIVTDDVRAIAPVVSRARSPRG